MKGLAATATLLATTAIMFSALTAENNGFFSRPQIKEHEGACSTTDINAPTDKFPAYNPGDKYEALVKNGFDLYKTGVYEYGIYINQHTWNGSYFNYDVTRNFNGNPSRVIFDADGLPMVHYEPLPESGYAGGYEYNPTTLAQFALMSHAKYLKGQTSELTVFLKAIRKLLAMQDANGGFAYPFPYHHFQNAKAYPPGWTSAIAQGQALSALARAYDITGDGRYLDAGNKALALLLTPVTEGGSRNSLVALDPSLTEYAIFEEYPVVTPDTKSNYTVNGFMHVIIGLYDWSNVTAAGPSASQALAYYRCSLTTLKKVVPLADLNGFSAYDLGHVVYGRPPKIHPSYHDTHVYMLYTLYLMTRDTWFKTWADKWARDVDPKLTMYKQSH